MVTRAFVPPGEGSSGWAVLFIRFISLKKNKKNGGGHGGLMALSVSTSIFITELQRVLREGIALLF